MKWLSTIENITNYNFLRFLFAFISAIVTIYFLFKIIFILQLFEVYLAFAQHISAFAMQVLMIYCKS